MGKSRGRGKSGRYKGGRAPGKPGGEEDGSGSEDERRPKIGGGQPSTVGMMPPSDSEEDEEGVPVAKPVKEVPKYAPRSGGQPGHVGEMPTDSEEDEDDSEEEDSDDEPAPAARKPPPPPEPVKRKKGDPDAPDPEQIAKDIERLKLIREKREADRLKRIADEGFDRYAPPPEGGGAPVAAKGAE